jgi:hypothetical protein
MVDELRFEDESSPWEHWKRDPEGYVRWAEEKKGRQRLAHARITGQGQEVKLVEPVGFGQIVPARKARRGP